MNKKEIEEIRSNYPTTIKLEKRKESKEVFLDINPTLLELEKENNYLRVGLNHIELPFFSRNKRREKGVGIKYLLGKGDAFLEVLPPLDQYPPGDFEEKVFLSLNKIMRDNGYKSSFIVTPGEIYSNIAPGKQLRGKALSSMKNAMETLSRSTYKFKNSLYSYEKATIIEDTVNTTIFNLRKLSISEVKEDGSVAVDRRKTYYQVSYSKYFRDNLISKGYLSFGADIIQMDSITRAIFSMLEKLRGYKLYHNITAFSFAKGVPLEWKKNHFSRTIETINNSLKELKTLEKIEGYRIIKGTSVDLTSYEVTYKEKHNKIKKETFWKEIDTSGMDFTVREEMKKIIDGRKATEDQIKFVMNILAKEYPTGITSLPKVIKKYINSRGAGFVKYAAREVVARKVKKPRADLLRLMDNEEFINKYKKIAKELARKEVEEQKRKDNSKLIFEAVKNEEKQKEEEHKKLKEIFLSYPEKEQKNIFKQYLENIPKNEVIGHEGAMTFVEESAYIKTIAVEIVKKLNLKPYDDSNSQYENAEIVEDANPAIKDKQKKKTLDKSKKISSPQPIQQTLSVPSPVEENKSDNLIDKKIISIYNKYEDIGMYVFMLRKSLRGLAFEEIDKTDLIEAFRFSNSFKGKIGGYEFNLKFEINTLEGVIEITELK